MIKKQLLFFTLLFFLSTLCYSQNEYLSDSIYYEKNIDYVEKRNFKEDLTQKYSGKDFEYTEEIIKEKVKD